MVARALTQTPRPLATARPPRAWAVCTGARGDARRVVLGAPARAHRDVGGAVQSPRVAHPDQVLHQPEAEQQPEDAAGERGGELQRARARIVRAVVELPPRLAHARRPAVGLALARAVARARVGALDRAARRAAHTPPCSCTSRPSPCVESAAHPPAALLALGVHRAERALARRARPPRRARQTVGRRAAAEQAAATPGALLPRRRRGDDFEHVSPTQPSSQSQRGLKAAPARGGGGAGSALGADCVPWPEHAGRPPRAGAARTRGARARRPSRARLALAAVRRQPGLVARAVARALEPAVLGADGILARLPLPAGDALARARPRVALARAAPGHAHRLARLPRARVEEPCARAPAGADMHSPFPKHSAPVAFVGHCGGSARPAATTWPAPAATAATPPVVASSRRWSSYAAAAPPSRRPSTARAASRPPCRRRSRPAGDKRVGRQVEREAAARGDRLARGAARRGAAGERRRRQREVGVGRERG